jgi:hypothetical protein
VHRPKLPREANVYSFYASNVKQKPNVSNLSYNHSNEFEKVKVQMCKKSATDLAKCQIWKHMLRAKVKRSILVM